MYSRILSQGVRKARKKHHDYLHEALFEWARGGYYTTNKEPVTLGEQTIANAIILEGHTIYPGEYYYYISFANDDGIGTCATRLLAHKLNETHKFYQPED